MSTLVMSESSTSVSVISSSAIVTLAGNAATGGVLILVDDELLDDELDDDELELELDDDELEWLVVLLELVELDELELDDELLLLLEWLVVDDELDDDELELE